MSMYYFLVWTVIEKVNEYSISQAVFVFIERLHMYCHQKTFMNDTLWSVQTSCSALSEVVIW